MTDDEPEQQPPEPNLDIENAGLNPHGQQYEVLERLEAPEHNRSRYMDDAKIKIPLNEGMDANFNRLRPMSWYFSLCFPMPIITVLLLWTNQNIQSSIYPASVRTELRKGEFFKHIGIRLCMVITPLRGGLDAYFSTETEPGTVYEAGNYGKRFGMSKNRFKVIQESLAFAPPANSDNDPWWQIRPFIDAFIGHAEASPSTGT